MKLKSLKLALNALFILDLCLKRCKKDESNERIEAYKDIEEHIKNIEERDK